MLSDPVALARIGEAGRKTALRYSWPNVTERIEAHILRARESRSART
jgi:hypothetical protein